MKLSKIFLCTLLVLPATTRAMEHDLLEQWKKDHFEMGEKTKLPPTASRATTAEKWPHAIAPEIFHSLLRFAAKKLEISTDRFVPTVFINEDDYSCINLDYRPLRVFAGKILPFFALPQKKFSIFHEAGHLLDIELNKNIKYPYIITERIRKEGEIFAETQAIILFKCFECAKAAATTAHGRDDFLKKKGYLTEEQIIKLAEKTYGKQTQCAYHRELEKLKPALQHSSINTFRTIRNFIAHLAPTNTKPYLCTIFDKQQIIDDLLETAIVYGKLEI